MPTRRQYVVPILIGGLAAGVLSSIPLVNTLNCCFGVWVLCGAGLAVTMVQHKLGSIAAGPAAAVGATCGVLCAAIVWVTNTIELAIFGATDLPAPAHAKLIELFGEDGSTAALIALSALLMLVFYPTFGAIGGVVARAIWRPSPPRSPPPAPPSSDLPPGGWGQY